MTANIRNHRDPFVHSHAGVATLKPPAFVPAVADDKLNAAIARRFGRPSNRPVSRIIALEDFLARYFATGCRAAA